MEVERAEMYSWDTVCWAEVWDRGHDSHSLFLNVTLSDIVGVVYRLTVNHKRWKNPNSYMKTETMKWQSTNYTANITTISICE